MSGRGQHFISQHFQKPFVISEKSNQIWMYRRGLKKPIRVSREDAGKQRDFYSAPTEDGKPSLDDLITAYEQTLVPIVDQLRSMAIGTTVDPAVASELVVHFSMRSQHLRKSISEIWNRLAKTVLALATDPTSVVGSRRLPAHRAPKTIHLAIKEQVLAREIDELSNVDADTLVRVFYMGLRENLDQLTRDARHLMSAAFGSALDESRLKIDELHQSLLLSSLAPPPRVEQMRELKWEVISHPHSFAIIPDCVCFGLSSEGSWQPLPLLGHVALVLMPLTPNSLLVGKTSPNQAFNVGEFNTIAASVCFDFYLSKAETDVFTEVEGGIGQAVRAQIEEMTSTAILDVIDTYLEADTSSQSDELKSFKSEKPRPDNYNYNISLYDFGDELLAREVAEKINAVVLACNQVEALVTLDGFTLAIDYEAALNSIDRGFETFQPVKSTNSPLGLGVAMPLTVKRDGELKTRFVLRAFLAELLISQDEKDVTQASTIIRSLLGGLVLDQLERTRFSGWMLERIATPIENYLYPHAGHLFHTYFAARFSSVSVDDADDYIASLQSHLPNLVTSCVERRRRYRLDGDLNEFLKFVTEQTGIILSRIASILGKYAGANGKSNIPFQLMEDMSKIAMGEWLQLFSTDLANFYENIEQWSDFEEIFFTHRHFERWLIFFGVVVEEQKEGQIYIHVPLSIDAEYLSELQREE